MPKKQKLRIYRTISICALVIFSFLYFTAGHRSQFHKTTYSTVRETPSPSSTQNVPFGRYNAPKIPHKPYYKIAMFGDSMTYALGIHGGKLSEDLNTLYQSTPGHQRIVIDNYAIGSKNILYLNTELTTPKTESEEVLQPVTTTHPDLILIESFGYNPLSQYGLINGEKKQIETLSDNMKFITQKLPNTAIMFISTISPNKETYAENEDPGSKLSDREQQAEERIAYIKNHSAYAKAHNIPLIDIYNQSLIASNDGNLKYINPSDHIHPSFAGIDFISQQIANYIYDSQLLPK